MRFSLSPNSIEFPSGRWIVGGIAGVLGFAVVAVAGHRWHLAHTAPAAIVFVCTETAETFLLPPQSAPALNPKTGRKSLVRGVYCAGCQRWYPAPPSNHRGGNPKPLVCKIHKLAMIYDGPDPSSDSAKDASAANSAR